ncbi:hypothetical protein B0H14DRAFT_3571258 [Mycena olivaceomarginata]|nr:hypothetical protein B0H14DRAFT_3571258 [Mycena olivaceomarginata]
MGGYELSAEIGVELYPGYVMVDLASVNRQSQRRWRAGGPLANTMEVGWRRKPPPRLAVPPMSSPRSGCASGLLSYKSRTSLRNQNIFRTEFLSLYAAVLSRAMVFYQAVSLDQFQSTAGYLPPPCSHSLRPFLPSDSLSCRAESCENVLWLPPLPALFLTFGNAVTTIVTRKLAWTTCAKLYIDCSCSFPTCLFDVRHPRRLEAAFFSNSQGASSGFKIAPPATVSRRYFDSKSPGIWVSNVFLAEIHCTNPEPKTLLTCSQPWRSAPRSVELAARCTTISHRCFYPTQAATSLPGPSAPSTLMESPSHATCAGSGAMPEEWKCCACASESNPHAPIERLSPPIHLLAPHGRLVHDVLVDDLEDESTQRVFINIDDDIAQLPPHLEGHTPFSLPPHLTVLHPCPPFSSLSAVAKYPSAITPTAAYLGALTNEYPRAPSALHLPSASSPTPAHANDYLALLLRARSFTGTGPNRTFAHQRARRFQVDLAPQLRSRASGIGRGHGGVK